MNANESKGVLAVIRSRAQPPGCDWEMTDETLLEAFDAVAELIDALKKAREWHLGDKYRFGDDSERMAWQQQLELYDAALARVGGGA